MKHTYKLTRWLTGILAICFFLLMGNEVKGQTNPSAHDLSTSNFSFTGFASGATTTYPTSMQGWSFGSEPGASFVGPPTADRALVASTAGIATGSIRNEVGNGISLLNSGTNHIGAIAVAVNTTGRTNVTVTWTAEQLNSGGSGATDRINGLRLQYRIGTSGDFTEVPATAYLTTNTTEQNPPQTFTNVALPPAVDNQPVVQIRWIYYISSGSANARDRIRLDDITIASTGASTPPTVTTGSASSITQTAAVLEGNITNAGSPAPTVRGFEYSTTDGFAIGTGTIVSSTGTFGTGVFTEAVSGLTGNTTYYYRAFATNTAGTTHGPQESFTTSATATVPAVVTNAATSVSNTGATLNGEVIADGGEPVTARGFVYSDTETTPEVGDGVSDNEASGSGVGVFDASVTGLTPNTLYYVQAYAINDIGTTHGGVEEFVTVPNAPTVGAGSDATFNSITANWTAPSPEGNQTYTYTVQISETSDFALVVDEETGIASTNTSFEFTGLNEGTEYFFRVRAVNASGSSTWSDTSDGISTLLNAINLEYSLYQENFAGFVSTATLPTGWSVSNTTYVGDWGSGFTAGLRGNDNVLGFQHTAATGVFTATLTIVNNTGATIQNLNVSYLGKRERVTETRFPEWTVEVDGIEIDQLSYSTENEEVVVESVVTGLDITAGDSFTITWSSDRGFNAGGSSRQIGISDVQVQVAQVATITEGNGAGWRFLSSPVASSTFAQLLGPIWTQGADGSNHPESTQPNVRRYDPTDTFLESDGVEETNYIPVTNLSNQIGLGTGFAIYVFELNDLDIPTSNTWPKVLHVTGAPNTNAVDFDLFPSADESDVFTLLGNPFAQPINFSGFTGLEDVGQSVYVYSNSAGFLSHNGMTGTLPGGRIAPFQGFFMFANDDDPKVTVPVEAINTTDATDLFSNPTPEIQIIASMGEDLNNVLWFSFNEYGSAQRNNYDALMLYPLAYRSFLNLYAIANETAFDIKNLPIELGEAIEIPVNLDAWTPGSNGFVPMTGEVTLSWPIMNGLPLDWSIQLIDNETGAIVDMKSSDSYTFTLGSNKNMNSLEHTSNIRVKTVKSDFQTRFTFVINPTTTSAPINGELPSVVSLSQNYPNPFNPTTQITYELPQAAEVRLDVFNVMGQRVATLVNASQNVGAHTVTFDAANLSSGVYVYRLQAGATVLTRKMTLVK